MQHNFFISQFLDPGRGIRGRILRRIELSVHIPGGKNMYGGEVLWQSSKDGLWKPLAAVCGFVGAC